MTKYVYAEDFIFMLWGESDEEVRLPYQDIKRVKDLIQHLPIYIATYPLTNHSHSEGGHRIKSCIITDMEEKEGFCEVTTTSGTIYRLITE